MRGIVAYAWDQVKKGDSMASISRDQTRTPRGAPPRGCLAHKDTVEQFLDQFEAAGFDITRDEEAGTIEVMDGPIAVYRALLKSPGVYLVMTRDSERVKWKE